MSMLRSLFLKKYPYRDNYGNQEDLGCFVEIHLANSSFDSDVLHISMCYEEDGSSSEADMNLTLEEVKELLVALVVFAEQAEKDRQLRKAGTN